MAAALEIRPLRPDDDRGGFSCGQGDLDRFFHHYAGQNQWLHGGATPLFLPLGSVEDARGG